MQSDGLPGKRGVLDSPEFPKTENVFLSNVHAKGVNGDRSEWRWNERRTDAAFLVIGATQAVDNALTVP